ncbi:Uncharacterised protein [Zhongshania aliphaticivorans]|nr:Uncharacterised protein [Zhongshania aliphaticivorans]
MNRSKEKMKQGHQVAFDAFHTGIQGCKSDDELAGFVQMICLLAAKTIHGMEGQKFKKDFLRGAISDAEKIVPKRVQ